METIKSNVPFFSQYSDEIDEEWRNRSCGIAALKMVMDFLRKEDNANLSAMKLIRMGIKKNGYGKNGWTHSALVEIAKDFGISARQKEFKKNPNLGCRLLIKSLRRNLPVLVSAVKNFRETDKFHIVLLTGIKINNFGKVKGFFYHDPDAHEVYGAHRFATVNLFMEHWRKMAIFVY